MAAEIDDRSVSPLLESAAWGDSPNAAIGNEDVRRPSALTELPDFLLSSYDTELRLGVLKAPSLRQSIF
jgi:hypothetical protein